MKQVNETFAESGGYIGYKDPINLGEWKLLRAGNRGNSGVAE